MVSTEFQNDSACVSDPTFITKIKEKLEAIPSEYLQPRHLHKLGLFGSHSAATHFVQSGGIPHVRVSPYRILILKEDVISYLKGKYHAAKVSL